MILRGLEKLGHPWRQGEKVLNTRHLRRKHRRMRETGQAKGVECIIAPLLPKKCSHPGWGCLKIVCCQAALFRTLMKAKIVITPKKAVLDPQGKTVQNALAQMGYTGIGAVHVGKYLEIELQEGDKEIARKQVNDACHRLLSNPVIEDYRFDIE